MQKDHKVNDIVMSKSELLDALKSNKARHKDAFDKASAAYRKQALKELDRLSKEMEKAKDPTKIRVYSNLDVPESHESDYDIEISMLTAHQGDTITVSKPHYRMYVLDQWEWSDRFNTTVSKYAR